MIPRWFLLDNSKRLLYNGVMMQAQAKRTTTHCPECDGRSKRFGKHRNGLQRYRCNDCRKTFTEEHKDVKRELAGGCCRVDGFLEGP